MRKESWQTWRTTLDHGSTVRVSSSIEYANKHSVNAFILSTDIFKAYDKTHVGYILQIMKQMGYTQRTLEILELILYDCKTAIMVFDGITVLINPGIEAGLPTVSPIVPNQHGTPDQEADTGCDRSANMDALPTDVNIFSSQLSDLPRLNEIFEKYELLSCTLLSQTKKTMILGLGNWRGEEVWDLPWLKPVTQLRVLGIQVEATYRASWSIVTKNVKALIQKWISRKTITLAGKIRISNILILAKVWYGTLGK